MQGHTVAHWTPPPSTQKYKFHPRPISKLNKKERKFLSTLYNPVQCSLDKPHRKFHLFPGFGIEPTRVSGLTVFQSFRRNLYIFRIPQNNGSNNVAVAKCNRQAGKAMTIVSTKYCRNFEANLDLFECTVYFIIFKEIFKDSHIDRKN